MSKVKGDDKPMGKLKLNPKKKAAPKAKTKTKAKSKTKAKTAPKKKAAAKTNLVPDKEPDKKVGGQVIYNEADIKALCLTLPDMFKSGESVPEVCVVLDICKQTFYNMLNTNSDLMDAYKKGLGKSEAWWITLGRAGAMGKANIQPATWIFNMKNRFSDDWSDRTRVEIDAPELTPWSGITAGIDKLDGDAA